LQIITLHDTAFDLPSSPLFMSRTLQVDSELGGPFLVEAAIHGIFLSFGLIIPLGVQNVFVFTQGAGQPKLTRALPAVITASLCDTLLILLSVQGVSLAVLTFQWVKFTLLAGGLLFLVYMGWSVWNAAPDREIGSSESMPVKRQISFAASVSLLNPHAILDTVGVIGTSALHYSGKEKWAFALACILVSWCWFFGLALAGKLLGSLDRTGRRLRVVNKVSAFIIWSVAVYLGWNMVQSL
jgi:L-lysine exporter family protein LysE/ArgO